MALELQKLLEGTSRSTIGTGVELDLVLGENGVNIDPNFLEMIYKKKSDGTFLHFPSEEKLATQDKTNKSGAEYIGVDGVSMATLSAGNLQAILEAIDAQLTTILSGGGLVGGVILEDGTVPMTANWDFGGFDLENVGDLYVNDTLYIVDNSTGSLSLSGDDIILKNLNGSSGNLILDVSSGDIVIQNDGTTMIETNGTDGITITGKAIAAQLNLPHAAFAPAANGDIWTTTLGLFARISGVTQKMPAVTAGGASITLDQTGGPVTWTWFWTKMDDVVTITPASSPSGTSTGATIFTLSGIPANLRPTTTSVTVRTDILDNGTIERAVMVIGTGGTATLSRWTGTAYSPNTFSGAGTLGIHQPGAFSYKIL